jgi:hypothetical protein
MQKLIRYWFLLAVLLVLSVSSSSSAKKKGRGGAGKAPSFSRGETERPSGWNQGKKKGWNTDTPPGIEKKDGWLPPGLSKERKEKEKEIKEKKIKEEKAKGKKEQFSSEHKKNISPIKEEKKAQKELKQGLKNQKVEEKLKGNVGKQE